VLEFIALEIEGGGRFAPPQQVHSYWVPIQHGTYARKYYERAQLGPTNLRATNSMKQFLHHNYRVSYSWN